LQEKVIQIGVLGCGRVVQNRYIEVFKDELKGVKVVAVCDIVKERADKVAKEIGANAVYDMKELLNRGDIDLIIVATESGNHYIHAKEILESGKHVITEKPPTFFVDQVLELEAFAKEKNLMYAVVFQNRLNPAMQILKRTQEDGRFGKVVLNTIRLRWCRYQDYYEDGWHGTWKMDGGVVNQQAIHHIDALQWVCGPVKEVSAIQSNALNKLEAEDTTVATLRFENGALGIIEVTTAARPEDFEASISVVGEKGFAVINGIALNLIETWNFVEKIKEDKDVPKKYSQDVPTGYGLSHGPLFQIIVDRLKGGRIDPPIAGSDSIAAINLVHAIYRSVETKQAVNMKDNPVSEKLGK